MGIRSYFSSGGGGGGMAIGDAVGSGTSGSVLFVDSSGNLAQNNTQLKWTDDVQLLVKTTNEAATGGALRLEFAGFNGTLTQGLTIRSTSATAYYPYHIHLENAAYGTGGTISCTNNHGVWLSVGSVPLLALSLYTATLAQFYVSLATQVGINVKLYASQTADAIQTMDSSSTVLFRVLAGGGVRFASMADSAAPNDSTYYSTTGSKLSYKDSGGTVHALY